MHDNYPAVNPTENTYLLESFQHILKVPAIGKDLCTVKEIMSYPFTQDHTLLGDERFQAAHPDVTNHLWNRRPPCTCISQEKLRLVPLSFC